MLSLAFVSVSYACVSSDGTLVTQRFHYSQSPLKRRSIVGWYRLVNDMRFHGVKPICVFDGKERTAAKRREVRTSFIEARTYLLKRPC